MADGTITVWQQPNGMWRWRWEPAVEGSGTVLVSHSPYDTLEEAEQTARESYPDARVEVPDPDDDTTKPRRRWLRRLGVLLLAVLLLVVVRRTVTRPRAAVIVRAARDTRPHPAARRRWRRAASS